MSMFDWRAPDGQPIVSDHFWVYWALTIPITLTILLALLCWWWYFVRVESDSTLEKMGGDHGRESAGHDCETRYQALKKRVTGMSLRRSSTAVASKPHTLGKPSWMSLSRSNRPSEKADSSC